MFPWHLTNIQRNPINQNKIIRSEYHHISYWLIPLPCVMQWAPLKKTLSYKFTHGIYIFWSRINEITPNILLQIRHKIPKTLLAPASTTKYHIHTWQQIHAYKKIYWRRIIWNDNNKFVSVRHTSNPPNETIGFARQTFIHMKHTHTNIVALSYLFIFSEPIFEYAMCGAVRCMHNKYRRATTILWNLFAQTTSWVFNVVEMKIFWWCWTESTA